MRITSDWHIHSRHSCDGACLPVENLLSESRALGITDFGLTDHVHTPYNLADVRRSRADFDRFLADPHAHFGIEASCVSQWELDEVAAGRHADPVYGVRTGGPPGGPLAIGVTGQDLERHGVEFVVAGTHWPMYVPIEREAVIRDYHRQNMFLALHPLVDIVAHPWWWHGHWQDADGMFSGDPWFDDFGRIPRSMHDEFASAAKAAGTAVEINLHAILLCAVYPERFKRQYAEYLAMLKEAGVSLSIGSDCHSAHYHCDLQRAAAMLEEVGIREHDLWRLPPRREASASR
jgi:histidinol phosphatase-like PHP family hydrolase